MGVGELYLGMIAVFFIGVLSAFIPFSCRKINWIAHSIAILGCFMAVLCAIFVFFRGSGLVAIPLWPQFNQIHFYIDGLAAYFLLVIGLAGGIISIYALGYCQAYYEHRFRALAALYNAFLLSMVLVVTAHHAAAFIISWEIMSFASFFLVNHEYEKPANMRAAYIYIAMTSVGTVFVIAAFLTMTAVTGSMNFTSFTNMDIDSYSKNLVFIFVILGFGLKAGVVPFHIWLPRAHPVAPTHVSALMSGVMVKIAIYGMMRFFLDFLVNGPVWWGFVVLLLAVISCVMGILYALMERDLKRLLAYSTVENIGIILLAIGAALVFMSQHLPLLAAVAWMAALYHILNHAIFKSILFMGAGAILNATQTKIMDQLGGLIKKMPYTSFFVLIGCIAIAGLPPLNGFVSEWMTFQTLFLLHQAIAGSAGKILAALLVAVLGLTGVLASACFVKAFGITFLAKPRSQNAAKAVEVSRMMLLAMAIASSFCIVLGVWPQALLSIISGVLSYYPVLSSSVFTLDQWHAIVFTSSSAAGGIDIPLTGLIVGVGFGLAFMVMRLCGKQIVRNGETWTCGIEPTSRMEYVGVGFSQPIRRAFHAVLRPHQEVLIQEKCGNNYFGRHLSYRVEIRYVINEILYRPMNRWILIFAQFLKKIQTGSVQLYIGYITVITIVVLIWSGK